MDTVKVYEEALLLKLIPDYTYWTNRRIKPEVLRIVGGGVASPEEKSKLSNRYVLPCRDDKERIVGWAGRLLTESSFAPRWKILGRKAHFLFPHLSIVERAVKAKGELILTEGQGDCLALMSAGIDNVYSLFGTELSSKIIGRIVALNPQRLIIATNNEERQGKRTGIGNRAADKIKNQLCAFVREEKVQIALPPLKDFADMTEEQIREWYEKTKEVISPS